MSGPENLHDNDALSRLTRASSRLWQIGNLRDGVEEILAASMSLLAADMGTIQLFDPRLNALEIVGHRGFEADFLDYFRLVGADHFSACGRALQSGERIVVEDIELDPEFVSLRDVAQKAGYRSVQATPLLSRDRAPLGVIATHYRFPHRPDPDDLRELDLYVHHAIGFIERTRLESNLRVSEARLGAIVDSSDDAIVSKTLEGIITSWNAGAQTLFGYSSDEAVGQSILMIVPPERHDEEAHILSRLRKGERINHFETVRLTKDGRRVEISLSVSPVRDPMGTIVGASKIARDITEKKRLDRDREALLEAERNARHEAQRINSLKDEFLTTLSHELRTPLSAILGWAQMMGLGTMTLDDMKEAGRVIERNSRIQKQLIDDLLDMSRIISGKLRLDLQQLDPVAFIDAAIETIRPSAAVKDIRIEKILDPVAGTISGDPARLQQVVWNLLSNAVKFTPKGGKVQIRLERVNSHLEVSVSDTGAGIDPAFAPHLFERFRQGDASTTRKFGGLGIGLAIVKEIVELHGGRVRAESSGQDQGSSFIVSLPLLLLKTPKDSARICPTAPSALPLDAGLMDLSGLKVLFVDDEPDARELVRRLLVECGADVTIAHNATEALDLIGRIRPEVLISDIGMPEMDGYELLRRLRASSDPSARTPAIALTAFARSEDRTRALRAGYIHHISKPIEPSELLATVAAVVGRVGEAS